jgi:hypothetical protein
MVAPILAVTPSATSWFLDHWAPTPPRSADMATLSSSLGSVLRAELVGAQRETGAGAAQILLAALARAVARTVGGGVLTVDVEAGESTAHGVALPCAPEREVSAFDLLAAIPRALAAGTAAPAPTDVYFAHGPATTAEYRHRLEVHTRLDAELADTIFVDWWYDTRSFDAATVDELAEQFPLALIELTSEGAVAG